MALPQAEGGWIKVWDSVVRIFHWTTLVLFCSAYYTAEFGQNEHHLIIGYSLAIVLIIRLIWGFVGTRYARFANFTYGPANTLQYVQSLREGRPVHYIGHNPLGAAMVFALLALLSGLVITGLVLTAALEFEGPLLWLNSYINDSTAYLVLGLHEFAVYTTFACVALHVMGVWIATRQHHENLVRAMITGKKSAHPSQFTSNHLLSGKGSAQ